MKSTGTTGDGLKLYPMTAKRYKCDRCGHVVEQTTNHYGPTWSFDRTGCCPKCPPWAKYGEFGGQTTWTCMELEPMDQEAKAN